MKRKDPIEEAHRYVDNAREAIKNNSLTLR